jgi:PPOX class probable F420-dependent enzyme
MVQRHEDDRRPEPEAVREPGDPPERHERVEHAPVRARRLLGPDDDVLGRPDRVEAELLGRLGDGTYSGGRRMLVEVRQDHTEVHDESVLRARAAASRVARLATIDPDGRPHLVPIVFALDGDTLYSAVDEKPKRSRRLRRIENARARADVTILVDEYDDDWRRLWWVRLRGRARVLDGGDEAEHALALLREKHPQYRDRPPGLPVLAVDVVEWRCWSARGPG